MAVNSDHIRSVAEPVLLSLLAERQMYGYEIIKVVNDRTNGLFEWKEGTLYPCLHRLQSDKLISSRWRTAPSGRRRKYYGITRKGKGVLARDVSEWREFSAAVNGILLLGANA